MSQVRLSVLFIQDRVPETGSKVGKSSNTQCFKSVTRNSQQISRSDLSFSLVTQMYLYCNVLFASNLFVSKGLMELWLRGGVGGKTRVGEPICEVLPAVHALTGSDMTSKFGTKAAGIKANPTAYLRQFGMNTEDIEDVVSNAEKYLVQVLNRGNHGIETMDQLRYTMYHQRAGTTIQDLPPASNATQGHILL